MKLFADCADLDVIKDLWEMKILSGITTNPVILAGSRTDAPGLARGLAGWFTGNVFIQAAGESASDLVHDAERARRLLPGQVIVKIPSTSAGFRAMADLEGAGAMTAATALFTLGQGLCAAAAGASVIIPFYDRLERAGGDPVLLLRDLSTLQDVSGKPRILVASVKTMGQLEQCFREGAWGVTLPPTLVRELSRSSLTDDAREKFRNAVLHGEE
jgi:transaldolase